VTSAGADLDVVIVGAGAAGLATAIFAMRADPAARISVLDGARQPGAKILVSGGSRCNVTNTVVTEADFNSGSSAIVRRVLRALPVRATIGFFAGLGVTLREEPNGKLFPESGRSRDVLDALLAELGRVGATLRANTRVLDLARTPEAFVVTTSAGEIRARAVVLATGGLSLPKTGSDGWGYGVAQRFGHRIVPTTPALVPLVLDAQQPTSIHQSLSGVSHPAELDILVDGAAVARVPGALLWTHFGLSGPAALDASRHWLRATLEGRSVEVRASVCPGQTFAAVDRRWTDLARARPRASPTTIASECVPASVAAAMIAALDLPGARTLATLSRDDRRRIVHALLEWPLAVTGSRGYAFAEVTAGGIPLDEIRPATMESRLVPGLYFVGEILDVDGRLGGFNFQWSWASARVAAEALAARRGDNRR
jgi:predicted Rossmann fold flavoprotein